MHGYCVPVLVVSLPSSVVGRLDRVEITGRVDVSPRLRKGRCLNGRVPRLGGQGFGGWVWLWWCLLGLVVHWRRLVSVDVELRQVGVRVVHVTQLCEHNTTHTTLHPISFCDDMKRTLSII